MCAVTLTGACGGELKGEPQGTDAAGPLLDSAPAQDEDAGAIVDSGSPFDVVIDVPNAGPYGTRVVRVPALSAWVNTGLFLRAGQSASITASGSWLYQGAAVDADGATGPDVEGCAPGMLVARTGLHYKDVRDCIGESDVFVAPRDGILYLGSNVSNDLGETYETRHLNVSGELEATVTSDGDTVPSIAAAALAEEMLSSVDSGWIEVRGAHTIITISTEDALADLATAPASVELLDEIYRQHEKLRGTRPHGGQSIRFFPDPDVVDVGYMLAGNPIRCAPAIMSGDDNQRILRSSEAATDIWGFAHELGHDFTLTDGTWIYMYANIESWPNIFTVHALRELGRTDQPNLGTYCDGRDAYLAAPAYETFRTDPFLQLCFLLEFSEAHGWGIWQDFFGALNDLQNADIPLDTSDPELRSTWGWIRDQLTASGASDAAERFATWAVPVP